MLSSGAYPRKIENGAMPSDSAAIDSIGEFGSEGGTHVPAASSTAPSWLGDSDPAAPSKWARWLVPVLAVLVVVQAPFVAVMALRALGMTQRDAHIEIETTPSAVEVLVDGTSVGRSPLQLSVAPGQRSIELRSAGISRVFPVTVSAGESVRHRFEFSPNDGVPLTATVGVLQVSTEPAGMTVTVDGRARGASPISVAGMAPGDHTVSVRFPDGAVERRVQIQAGTTSAVHLLAPAGAGAGFGWLSVESPATTRILEDGRLLGTSDVERLVLPVGDHVLDFENEDIGFTSRQRVRVTARSTSTVSLDLPPGTVSINASPWAEVWLDGERIGETPIGNLTKPSGRHEVVLRHPDLGERRTSVVIRPNRPARVSVDFRSAP